MCVCSKSSKCKTNFCCQTGNHCVRGCEPKITSAARVRLFLHAGFLLKETKARLSSLAPTVGSCVPRANLPQLH